MSSWANVDDEAIILRQVAGSVPRQRLVDEGRDLELDVLPHCKPVQLAEKWRYGRIAKCASPTGGGTSGRQ